MERIEDEGVFYEGGDLDTLYVNNTTTEDTSGQQYEFADVSMGHAQQEWEPEAEPGTEVAQSEQGESNPVLILKLFLKIMQKKLLLQSQSVFKFFFLYQFLLYRIRFSCTKMRMGNSISKMIMELYSPFI